MAKKSNKRTHPLKQKWYRQLFASWKLLYHVFFFGDTWFLVFTRSFAGWSPTGSGGKVRRSMCFCSDNGWWCSSSSWIKLHRWRSSFGSVHGGLLWDAHKVWARTLQTLKGSHALPSKDRVPVQKSYNFFLRLWWWPSPSLYILSSQIFCISKKYTGKSNNFLGVLVLFSYQNLKFH